VCSREALSKVLPATARSSDVFRYRNNDSPQKALVSFLCRCLDIFTANFPRRHLGSCECCEESLLSPIWPTLCYYSRRSGFLPLLPEALSHPAPLRENGLLLRDLHHPIVRGRHPKGTIEMIAKLLNGKLGKGRSQTDMIGAVMRHTRRTLENSNSKRGYGRSREWKRARSPLLQKRSKRLQRLNIRSS
jgi:hypothetical protein